MGVPPDEDIALAVLVAVDVARLYLVHPRTFMSKWRSCRSLREATVSSSLRSVVEFSAIGGEKCNSGSGYVVQFPASDWLLNHRESVTEPEDTEVWDERITLEEGTTLTE